MTKVEDIKKILKMFEKHKRDQDKIQKKMNKTYDKMQKLRNKYIKIFKNKTETK